MRNNVIKKYTEKVLGSTTWGSIRKFYINDFIDINQLSHIIADTYSAESLINKDGMDFLKEYYGLSSLAKLLEDNGGVEAELLTADSILRWLRMLDKENE